MKKMATRKFQGNDFCSKQIGSSMHTDVLMVNFDSKK